jgi:alpha,alpha-trehalase
MDGVVTDTAGVHARVWQRLFDDYLRFVAESGGPPLKPFGDGDYRRLVDGRARVDGVVAFLASRGITLPPGEASDAPDEATAWGLANRKNELFVAALAEEGVQVFSASVALLRRLRALGVRTAVVTASRNAAHVLGAGGVAPLFDACVDGIDAERLGLAGKPDPATFLGLCGASERTSPAPWSSRMLWPVSKPAGAAGSDWSSVWTGSGRRRRCWSTAPMSL